MIYLKNIHVVIKYWINSKNKNNINKYGIKYVDKNNNGVDKF